MGPGTPAPVLAPALTGKGAFGPQSEWGPDNERKAPKRLPKDQGLRDTDRNVIS